MATVVERQMTTQHFRTEQRSQSQHSQHVELMTPEGDLGDVEADFQRMVNEMVSDGSRKAVTQTSKMSYSTSSQMSQKSAPKSLTIKIPNRQLDAGIVKALPAKVTPESGSEVVVEKSVGVRDRIKRIENQKSFEEAAPPYPPALPRAVTKSSSVKNLSEQYEKSCESVNKYNEMTTSQKVDGEFVNVKDVASRFQHDGAPARPPAPFLSDTEDDKSYSRGVAKSSSHPAPFSSYSEQSSKYANYQTQSSATSSAHNELDSALADIDRYTSELDKVDSKPTELPLQYSAKVKCEVTSRVNEPQTEQVSSEITSQVRQSRYDSWSSSTQRTDMTSAECSSPISKFTPAAPTPLARTLAKPPKADSENTQSKFSLLRSASAGSAGAFEEGMRYSTRSNSDKDLKCNVKRVNYGSSVWTPGAQSDHSVNRLESPDLPSFKDVPPVWTPARGGSASPSCSRREYKKISFDGPTVPKRNFQDSNTAPRPEESFAWKDREAEINLPRVQSPTVTLLQKKREGQINDHKAEYLKGDDTGGYFKPGDKLYTIKKEYESEDEEHGTRKFAILGNKKIEGVGPTTRDGIPVSLKTGVKSEHQGEWYKRMFDSLHKVKDDSSNRYQNSKVRYGGYMSEPDGYDSDAGVTRYGRFDRSKNEFEVEQTDNTLSRKAKRYAHQPGRIEDYVPGFSSLSERELRENPEADVKLEISAPSGRPSKETFQGGRKSAYNVFKDGYESDSTLVFKKREENRLNIPDPRKSSELYRQIQKGGDIPLSGLQRPAPRNKAAPSPNKYETSEVNIHYRTPIRVERKEAVSDEELARRQEEHMQKVYELERRKKYLQELEDIERRRHTDNFTPLQKSPIPLNRYDDESYGYGGRTFKTPEPPRQLAKALFGFQAQNKRELSFNKGDTILIRRQIDKNWLEGEFRGIIGIFPSNYVEVQPLKNLETLGKRPSEGQAKVKFNFQAQTTMEMSLNKGEFVVLTRRVDGNWYEGRVGQRKGIFPVSYVEVLSEPINGTTSPSTETMSRPALPPAHLLFNGTSSANSPYSTLGYPGNHSDTKAPYSQLTVSTQQEPVAYRALYNYKPQNDDELELLEGDVVMVMEKCDDGWFVGTSQRTNLFGTFPGNYVEKI